MPNRGLQQFSEQHTAPLPSQYPMEEHQRDTGETVASNSDSSASNAASGHAMSSGNSANPSSANPSSANPSSTVFDGDLYKVQSRAPASSVSFRHVKSPYQAGEESEQLHQRQHQYQPQQYQHQHHSSINSNFSSTNTNWQSLKPVQPLENYQSALGITFDRPGKIESPSLSNYTRSPSLDLNDTGFQPISRSNTFDFYRNNNNSDISITTSIFNGAGNAGPANTNQLTSTISNLTFSPLSMIRTNTSDNGVTSPKEKATPLRKAKLLAQKATHKTNRDFLSKKKTSNNNDDNESILKGITRRNSSISKKLTSSANKLKSSDSSTSISGLGGNKKNIFTEISSLPKPRVPSVSDMQSLRRSSSESRRIPTTINELSDSGSIKSHHHHHHHHHHHLLLRSRKDNVPNVLSSSSSNSKLISDYPALYNFHPNANNTNEVLRIISSIESEMLVRPNLSEDKKSEYADKLLTLLYSCVLPLFKGEVLATPIEDLNKLVEVYLMVRINKNDVKKELSDPNSDNYEIATSSDAKTIIREFQDMVKVGISLMQNQSNIDNITQKDSRLTRFGNRFSFGSTSSFSDSLSSFGSNDSRKINNSASSIQEPFQSLELEIQVAALWDFFLHDILSYLEAIFLPLQMEFDGCGIVLNNPSIAHDFWSQLLVPDEELNVKRYILLLFRDAIIIPMVEKLGNVNNFFATGSSGLLQEENDKQQDNLYPQKLCLLQCFGILSTTRSKDYNQKVVDSLLDVMKRQIKI